MILPSLPHKILRSMAVSVAMVVAMTTIGAQQASARQGSDDTTRTTAPATTTTTTPTSTVKTDDTKPAVSTVNKTEVERHVQDMHAVAQQEIEKRKQTKASEPLSDTKRKTVCENKQQSINNKLATFTQAADKHLGRLDEAYTKVQSYQAKNNVVLANYDELVATANEKKQTAIDAIAALKTVAVQVDCNQPDAVVKLGTVRDAAKATRSALHDYRMAIKAIVVALAQGKDVSAQGEASSDSATTGGAQ